MATSDNSKILVATVGFLLTIIGLLLGHITTREAMAQETARLLNELNHEYVPRTEVELQLKIINEKLDEALTLLKENG